MIPASNAGVPHRSPLAGIVAGYLCLGCGAYYATTEEDWEDCGYCPECLLDAAIADYEARQERDR